MEVMMGRLDFYGISRFYMAGLTPLEARMDGYALTLFSKRACSVPTKETGCLYSALLCASFFLSRIVFHLIK